MEKNVIIAGLAMLIIGFGVGYVTGVQNAPEIAPSGMHSMSYGSVMSNTSGMNMEDSMTGMMSGLAGKSGPEFERAFLEEMIVHHEGAVAMAKKLLEESTRPELVALGNDIITAQTKEIAMMKNWLIEWFQE